VRFNWIDAFTVIAAVLIILLATQWMHDVVMHGLTP
jgi:hypothetical protein